MRLNMRVIRKKVNGMRMTRNNISVEIGRD